MVDDILLQLPTTVKARTEEIVIRNQDPNNKRVDVYQSLRPMNDDVMGEPLKHFMSSAPVEDLAGITINGLSGLQIIEWIAIWAAGVNAADGPKQVAAMLGNPPTSSPVEPVGPA